MQMDRHQARPKIIVLVLCPQACGPVANSSTRTPIGRKVPLISRQDAFRGHMLEMIGFGLGCHGLYLDRQWSKRRETPAPVTTLGTKSGHRRHSPGLFRELLCLWCTVWLYRSITPRWACTVWSWSPTLDPIQHSALSVTKMNPLPWLGLRLSSAQGPVSYLRRDITGKLWLNHGEVAC